MAKTKKATTKKTEKPALTGGPEIFMPCEWVIQFDDDEPQIFATADNTTSVPEVVIKLQNTSESHITFSDPSKNKKFKMYARPRQ